MDQKTSLTCIALAAMAAHSPLLTADGDEPALSSQRPTIAVGEHALRLQTAGPFGGERWKPFGERPRSKSPRKKSHRRSGEGHRPHSGGSTGDAPELNAGGAVGGLSILFLGLAIALGRRPNERETINE